MTPNQVHYGHADEVYAARKRTLENAFAAKPNRFVKSIPAPPKRPTAAWINPPHIKPEIQTEIPSLNSKPRRLIVVDTFRSRSVIMCRFSGRGLSGHGSGAISRFSVRGDAPES